jgi:outer membrane protein
MKNKSVSFGFLVFLLLWSLNLFGHDVRIGRVYLIANPKDTIKLSSLDETFALLIKNNLSQAIYQQQIKQAQYNLKAAKGILYPNINGSFGGQDNLHLAITPVPGELIGKPGTTFNAQFGKKYGYNTGLTASQQLVNWQSFLQISIEKQNIGLNQLSREANIQLIKDQAGKYYCTALIAKNALQIESLDLSLADSLVTSAQLKLRDGTIDALALNQAEINVHTIQVNIAQSQQLYDYGMANLKILLGMPVDTGIVLTEDIGKGLITQSQQSAIGKDKNLAIYQQQMVIAGLQSKTQRAVAYPNLSMSVYWGSQQYRNDFGLSFQSGAWQPYRYIGLNLTVPLFSGFTNSSKYKSALIQKDIAVLQYQNAKLQSEVNDDLLIRDLANYSDAARASFASFQLYGSNLQLNRQKYQEGVINIEVYQRCFQDYLTAENNYLNNLSQFLTTRSTILSRQ